MRIDEKNVTALCEMFAPWVVGLIGEDVVVHITPEKFTVELLRQHAHVPRPRTAGASTLPDWYDAFFGAKN